jgi:hypothetical protein
MSHIVLFNSLLILCCGYALLKGGVPERIVAAIFLCAGPATYVALWAQPEQAYQSVDMTVLLIDTVMLVGLAALAISANRYWPIWVVSLQSIIVAVHGVKAFDPTLVAWTYAVASGKLAYPQLALLALGTWRHRRRQKTIGTDNSWVSSSHPS